MSVTATILTKNVWTKVLTNVTYSGSVYIIDQDTDPTKYMVTYVATGGDAPSNSYIDGITFEYSFSPSSDSASDYYIMPVDYDGRVVIFT